jgi:hypothetical protein
MTENEKLKHCVGCRDDFYNDKNPMGVKRCWGLKTAKMVTRYRTGTWTRPTEPGAFTECKVLNCYHQDGQHYIETLPDFVKRKDVIRASD